MDLCSAGFVPRFVCFFACKRIQKGRFSGTHRCGDQNFYRNLLLKCPVFRPAVSEVFKLTDTFQRIFCSIQKFKNFSQLFAISLLAQRFQLRKDLFALFPVRKCCYKNAICQQAIPVRKKLERTEFSCSRHLQVLFHPAIPNDTALKPHWPNHLL